MRRAPCALCANIAFFLGIRNGHIAVLKAAAAHAIEKDPQPFAEAEKKLKNLVGKRPRKPNSGLGSVSWHS